MASNIVKRSVLKRLIGESIDDVLEKEGVSLPPSKKHRVAMDLAESVHTKLLMEEQE